MRQYLLPEDFAPSGLPGLTTGRLRISGKDFHYLTHVLRLKKGETFPGIDRRGEHYKLQILETQRDSLILSVHPTAAEGDTRAGREEATEECRIYLFQALLKGKKMDTVIRQASEAGVHHIIPVLSEHTVVRRDDDRREAHKQDRRRTIIGEAVQQSGATAAPELHETMSLGEAVDFWKKESTNSGPGLFFHQYPLENSSLHGYLSNWPHRLALLIGPEGGFSDGETDFLRTAGFFPVYLQTNILRAETAAIYAIGAIQTILREQGKWQIAQSPR